MNSDQPVVLIVGATGRTGRIVEAVARHDMQPRALVRDPDHARPLVPAAEVVKGDLEDVSTLTQAVSGIDAVIFAHGSDRDVRPDAFERIDYGGVAHVLRALDREARGSCCCRLSSSLTGTMPSRRRTRAGLEAAVRTPGACQRRSLHHRPSRVARSGRSRRGRVRPRARRSHGGRGVAPAGRGDLRAQPPDRYRHRQDVRALRRPGPRDPGLGDSSRRSSPTPPAGSTRSTTPPTFP